MTVTEELLRLILGPVRSDVRPLAVAVDYTIELLYHRQIAQSDIHVTTDVYPYVARATHKKAKTIAKAVERLAIQCWESLDAEQIRQIIGKPLARQPSPREVLFYLAYYVHHRQPFYQARIQELFSPVLAF